MNQNQDYISNVRELFALIKHQEHERDILEVENLLSDIFGNSPKHYQEIKEINERIEKLWQVCYKLPQRINNTNT